MPHDRRDAAGCNGHLVGRDQIVIEFVEILLGRQPAGACRSPEPTALRSRSRLPRRDRSRSFPRSVSDSSIATASEPDSSSRAGNSKSVSKMSFCSSVNAAVASPAAAPGVVERQLEFAVAIHPSAPAPASTASSVPTSARIRGPDRGPGFRLAHAAIELQFEFARRFFERDPAIGRRGQVDAAVALERTAGLARHDADIDLVAAVFGQLEIELIARIGRQAQFELAARLLLLLGGLPPPSPLISSGD